MLEGRPLAQQGVAHPAAPSRQYLAGAWRDGRGEPRVITSPINGSILSEVADASPEDLDAAVAAAKSAQPEWRRAGPATRARALKEAASRLRAHGEELALTDVFDCGAPLRGMRFDVSLGATLMEFFAGLATEAKGETIPNAAGKLTFVQREPLGVVGRIVPFNHPLMFAAAKIAAPLAAGNAVILKPSEETPLSALRMAEIIGDLFPEGVLSVLTGGAQLGAAMCEHPGIAALGLIGSVRTGRAVLRAGAESLKRTQLELGGKNALIVAPDADLDAAIAGAVKGMNLGWTAGQSCGSTSRVLVHSSVYDRFVEGLKDAFDRIALGDPTREETEMGSLATRAQFEKVTAHIDRARAKGATMLAGGDVDPALSIGCFVRPTLFGDVAPEMSIAREEVFGPVLSVLRWTDEERMIAIANSLDVGLTASIWTRDLDVALRLIDRIEAGYVWVNEASDHYLGAPFGGVKQSGIGREECLGELLAYTEAKTVTIVPRS